MAEQPEEPIGTAADARMSRRLERGDLKAVADARGMLRAVLTRWGAPPELAGTAELLVSELVTNALVHTGLDAVLVASVSGRPARCRVHVEVRDQDPRRPAPRDPGDDALSGRGLLLVEHLADAWGIRPCDRGKAVWFELRCAPGPEPATRPAPGRD